MQQHVQMLNQDGSRTNVKIWGPIFFTTITNGWPGTTKGAFFSAITFTSFTATTGEQGRNRNGICPVLSDVQSHLHQQPTVQALGQWLSRNGKIIFLMIIYQHVETAHIACVLKLETNLIDESNMLKAICSVWTSPESFLQEMTRRPMDAGCRYLLVGCYALPVTRDGASLLPIPGRHEAEDQPWPGLDEEAEGMAQDEAGEEQLLPEEDEPMEEDVEEKNIKAAKSMYDTWHRLVEEAKNVAVKQLTFVEPVKSRAVKHMLPALARMHSRIRALGLPPYRLHSDRAREFCSQQVAAWALERNLVTTTTSGSSFKSNGRCEAEVGAIRKSIRVLISAGTCTLQHRIWENIAYEECLLRFGAKAHSPRKSWQARYAPWREAGEEVKILGPDKHSSLTNTGYYACSTSTGRCFFTDDIIIIPEAQQPGVEDQVLYLPGRDAEAPQRRHRQKAQQPAISMFDIEGETKIVTRHPEMFEPTTAQYDGDSSDGCRTGGLEPGKCWWLIPGGLRCNTSCT